jgi:hypothetical protein
MITDLELEIEDMMRKIPGTFIRAKDTGEIWIVIERENEGVYTDEKGNEYDPDDKVVKRYFALEYMQEGDMIPQDGIEVPDMLTYKRRYEFFDINNWDDGWEDGCSFIIDISDLDYEEEWEECKREEHAAIFQLIKSKTRLKKLKKINNL